MERKYYVKQYVYKTNDTNNNIVPGQNIFESSEFVVKIGIQAYPGLRFSFTENDIDSSLIVGNSGIFELDLETTGDFLNQLYVFPDDSYQAFCYPIIIDVVGFTQV